MMASSAVSISCGVTFFGPLVAPQHGMPCPYGVWITCVLESVVQNQQSRLQGLKPLESLHA